MKKGNGIALTIAAVFAALGIGIITGGTLVSSDNSTSTTATQTEDVCLLYTSPSPRDRG